MAKFIAGPGTKANLNSLKLLSHFSGKQPDLVSSGPNGFTIQSDNYTAVFTGYGFSSPNPLTDSGNITTLVLYSGSGALKEEFRVIDLNLSPLQASRFAASEIFKGNDNIDGSDLADILKGYTGNDTLKAGKGNDTVDGGNGRDNVQGGTGNDKVFGGSDKDKMLGGAGKDKMDGGTGNDTLQGDAGRDTLQGGLGKDTLKGGADRDMFFFDKSVAGNADKLADFKLGQDKIMFGGVIAAGLAKIGIKDNLEIVSSKTKKAKQDQDDDRHAAKDKDGAHLIYNADSGFLYYDADGEGGKAPVHVATITNDSGHHPTSLSYTDFIIG